MFPVFKAAPSELLCINRKLSLVSFFQNDASPNDK